MSTFNEGDKVYVRTVSYGGSLRRGEVVRVTKTQAVVKTSRGWEERFNRETGRGVGGRTWDTSRIDHPTASLDADHPTASLDAEWKAERADTARRMLADVARKSTSTTEEIRAAFAKWDALSPDGNTEGNEG